jgi:GntR family transcriptional regulator, transcriptional repressor for pyruvate dehydrogenase complex
MTALNGPPEPAAHCLGGRSGTEPWVLAQRGDVAADRRLAVRLTPASTETVLVARYHHARQRNPPKGSIPVTSRHGPEAALEAVGGIDIKRSAKINAATARQLAKQIIENNIAPGTMLPAEKDLAESFGIGRGTMREALRLLETFGLIEMRTGRYGGPVVRRPDARDLSVSLTLAFFANGSSMLDVLEARQALEPSLAELAAERINEEAIRGLRETIEVMRRPEGTEAEYLDAAERFHNIAVEAAQSPVLIHLSEGLHHIAGGETVGISYSVRERLATATAHEKIADALEAHDGPAARELWKVHLAEAGTYWKRRYPENARRAVEWTLGLDREL